MSQLLRKRQLPPGQRLEIAQGDITREVVGAIVNAANARLQHGGGVAAAIVRRGGREIQRQSNQWVREQGPVTHAEPAYTDAGELPCRYVIHAVGPVWGEGDEDAKLAAAVDGSLRRADQLELASAAFPAISTGIFGFPKERAAKVIYQAVSDYFEENPTSGLERIRLTLFDQPTVEAFLQVWDEHFPKGDE
jgi:O-acetyl-ADP-ribose deacetylase (regulator of RNase III)